MHCRMHLLLRSCGSLADRNDQGIGSTKAPHPAQQRIAMASGSQCGFCTPGIVMVRL